MSFHKHIYYFNEKYLNGKLISSKSSKVFHCLLIRNMPQRSYKAYVVDINYKNVNKNKRALNAAGPNYNFQNSMSNQNEAGPNLVINLLIAELGLEIVNFLLMLIYSGMEKRRQSKSN